MTIANLTRLLLKNRSLCEGFIFSDAGRPVGTIWVMYQGANDIEYRIRRIEAYIFDVYINENYRGNGYAGEMICLLMKYLHERGIDCSYLAVAKTNKSAIKAYKKTIKTAVEIIRPALPKYCAASVPIPASLSAV